jgi:hypothetical protein
MDDAQWKELYPFVDAYTQAQAAYEASKTEYHLTDARKVSMDARMSHQRLRIEQEEAHRALENAKRRILRTPT